MIPTLAPDSWVPLYRQLIDALRSSIAVGEFSIDQRILTEAQLSQRYGISRITVREAIDALVEEDLLIRRQGKGTYVARPHIGRDMAEFRGFTNACEAGGQVAGTQVLSIGQQSAGEDEASFLGIRPGKPVVALRRLRFADGVPIMIEQNIFARHYSFLLQEDLSGSLYRVLQKYYITPSDTVKAIGISYASREEAALLQVEPGIALLCIDDYVRDSHQNPLHCARQIIRSDRYKLYMRGTCVGI